MHYEFSIPTHCFRGYLAKATHYRATETLCYQWGYVYLFRGEWAGWTLEFPDPTRWCPGVVIVSPGEDVYVTVGGDNEKGATDVIRLIPGTIPDHSNPGDSMVS